MSFFSKLGSAIEGAAKTVEKDLKNLENPLEVVKGGTVVKLQAKINGKCIQVFENGAVDCTGVQGSICEFHVEESKLTAGRIKFRNVALDRNYLAIVQIEANIYLVGNAGPGPESDFVPLASGNYISLQSSSMSQAHVGALPTGQMTAPGMTPANTEASLFKPIYVRRSAVPAQPLPPPQ